MGLERVPAEWEQALPIEFGGDGRGTAHQPVLIVHLEEQQVGVLLQVVAVRDAVVAQDVASAQTR